MDREQKENAVQAEFRRQFMRWFVRWAIILVALTLLALAWPMVRGIVYIASGMAFASLLILYYNAWKSGKRNDREDEE